MPIEIRELVIRTVVNPEDLAPSRPGSDGPADSSATAPAVDLDRIVQECVRQVLRVLAHDRER